LESGGVVRVRIYTPRGDRRRVPDLSGMPLSVADHTLMALQMKLEVFLGDPASGRERHGTIQRQEPPPGADPDGGKTIKVWVYSK
ncbi:MAG: PASTA domain-containing protein, partial [Verrucomicrobiota bacterium]